MLTKSFADLVGSYRAKNPRYRPMGRMWPNGEFSLGYAVDGVATTDEENTSFFRGGRFMSAGELDERLTGMEELLAEQARFYSMTAQAGIVGLTLSNALNSHERSEPVKYGLHGITGHGAKMLRSSCWLLEECLGKDDVVMVTLTVPTLVQESRQILAQRWGRVVNRLVQYLSRELLSAGRTPVIAGCVEIQSMRLEKYQQGYLHLHLVCPKWSNNGGGFAVKAGALRTWWKAEIERTIGCQLTVLPRVETAQVYSSVEGYLGKYLSKGGGDELAAFIGDLGESAVPGQWWFMSSRMRDVVKSRTAQGANVGAVLDALVNHLLDQGTGEGFEYIRHIDCDFSGHPVTVGWVGRLSPELAAELREFCSA